MSTLFDGIGGEILSLLRGYVAAQSCTGTPEENSGADYFFHVLRDKPYFAAHPEHLIRSSIPDDPLGRAVCCALFRGASPDTVVMIHHYDVTGTEDYGRFASLAFQPDKLMQALRAPDVVLEPEAAADLQGGGFLFGHGACDMKGGGSIQLALLSRLSEHADFPGTLIVLGVPDEENLSAGMRAAVPLLVRLQERYGLRYQLLINSEPHQRRSPAVGVFSVGSAGKLLPFVYARGRMSHAGKAAEGLNPLAVISRIVAATEGLPFTADGAPAPTWLMLRDDKLHYDVSMPRSAFGCMSVLTFHTPAARVQESLRAVCEKAFADYLAERSRAFGLPVSALPWQPRVYSWTQLRREAEAAGGAEWAASLRTLLDELRQEVRHGRLGFADAYRRLLEFTCNELPDVPMVVYGFLPPYYPAVTNANFDALPERIASLDRQLAAFARECFGQDYETEDFFTGLSDLSYGSASAEHRHSQAAQPAFIDEMPLYGESYSLPFEEMRAIAMPCINIGPWGKDFHKLTERVCLSDLTERTPELLYQAIRIVLGAPEY